MEFRIGLTYPLPCHTSAPSSFAHAAACMGCCTSSHSWKAPATNRRNIWRYRWFHSSSFSLLQGIEATSSFSLRHCAINLSTLDLKSFFQSKDISGRRSFKSVKCRRASSSLPTMPTERWGSRVRERTISAHL